MTLCSQPSSAHCLWKRVRVWMWNSGEDLKYSSSPQVMRKMLHWGILGVGGDGVDVFPLIQNYPLMTKPNPHVYYLSEAAFSFLSQSFWLSEKPCLPLLKELGPADVGVSLKDESPVSIPWLKRGILDIAVNHFYSAHFKTTVQPQ